MSVDRLSRFSAALGDKTTLLAHARAIKAADALQEALGILQQLDATDTTESARQVLAAGLATQQRKPCPAWWPRSASRWPT